ncbi:MAG TPA: site-specific integrase [Ktedonobacterales bacterium]|nr:site-specific integrase [Ktedonobacterales bacterium]
MLPSNASSPPRTYSVLPLLMESGERLPLLVESKTWIPPRLAMRWMVLDRRKHTQSSTLAGDLRVLGKLYTWADLQQIDLDQFLGAGRVFNAQQVKSLVHYYKGYLSSERFDGLQEVINESALSAASFDHHVSITQSFLIWVLRNTFDPDGDSFEKLEGACAQIAYLFHRELLKPPSSPRHEPLTDHEVEAIRQAIGPPDPERGPWIFPYSSFSQATRLRNWLMFEMALGLGLRRGELLKLRLDGIPRGNHQHIEVVRLPDDPLDSRRIEPAVKTAERAIPTAKPIPRALRAYLMLRPPLGRVAGKSPYLFTARTGDPISIDTANDIIAAIGKQCGIDLCWHRLRHTWAEYAAEVYLSESNGLDRLMYLGGWTSERSVRHYVKRAIRKQAEERWKAYQESTPEEEPKP